MEDSIKVYSLPSCGMCRALKRALSDNNIPFDVCEDEKEMAELGIKNVPILSVNGKFYNFNEARAWIEEQ